MTTRFDDSLPRLAKIVVDLFGADELAESAVVRDAGGRLSIVLRMDLSADRRKGAESEIRKVLGGYARPDQVVSDINGSDSYQLLEEASLIPPISIGDFKVRVLDRRVVGADWLRAPASLATRVPRIVLASLKGGVGRSTALCILASHFSLRGRRVLAIDFDLEAPGIGTMLLAQDQLPPYGTLDYLIENSISGIDSDFMTDLSGDSFLGAYGARVTVVPAIGKRTVDNPADALSKISRAYLEDPGVDGPPLSLTDQFNSMIERLESSKAYDVILIDARAGLHESTAAAILGIGAEVLLFGIDHPQTFLGYRLLMAHLGRLKINPEDDWRDRIRFVNAKALSSSKAQSIASEHFNSLYEIVAPRLSGPLELTERLTANDFELGWLEESNDQLDIIGFTPPAILHVLDDPRFRHFDPVTNPDVLTPAAYSESFNPLIDYADQLIDEIEFGEL